MCILLFLQTKTLKENWLVLSTPLKNMTSSVGIMKFPIQYINIYRKSSSSHVPVTTNQKISRNGSVHRHVARWFNHPPMDWGRCAEPLHSSKAVGRRSDCASRGSAAMLAVGCSTRQDPIKIPGTQWLLPFLGHISPPSTLSSTTWVLLVIYHIDSYRYNAYILTIYTVPCWISFHINVRPFYFGGLGPKKRQTTPFIPSFAN